MALKLLSLGVVNLSLNVILPIYIASSAMPADATLNAPAPVSVSGSRAIPLNSEDRDHSELQRQNIVNL